MTKGPQETGERERPSMGRQRVWPLVAALFLLLAALGVLAMCLGNYQISPPTVARILIGTLPGIHVEVTWPHAVETVILQVRLPRTLGAACVGAALALSGATYQGVFRNPLVSPDLLGCRLARASAQQAQSSCTPGAHPCRSWRSQLASRLSPSQPSFRVCCATLQR